MQLHLINSTSTKTVHFARADQTVRTASLAARGVAFIVVQGRDGALEGVLTAAALSGALKSRPHARLGELPLGHLAVVPSSATVHELERGFDEGVDAIAMVSATDDTVFALVARPTPTGGESTLYRRVKKHSAHLSAA